MGVGQRGGGGKVGGAVDKVKVRDRSLLEPRRRLSRPVGGRRERQTRGSGGRDSLVRCEGGGRG